MVCYGVRTCEDCASLTILTLAVAIPLAIGTRKVVREKEAEIQNL